MPFDFQFDVETAVNPGQTNYHAGVSAEQAVARYYMDQGAKVRESRWRGRCGEIDLILQDRDQIVFVEVKKSKTHAAAAARITPRQMARVFASGEDYLGQCPHGTLTESRCDVALVDAKGEIEIISNVSMMM